MYWVKYKPTSPAERQKGAAAVEFAIVAIFFFTLLFGIIEFGRMLYLYNTVQEATRNLARKAVVALVTNSPSDAFKRNNALFGGNALPGAPEVTAANVTVDFLSANGSVLSGTLPNDQLSECLSGGTGCVAFVRVRVHDVADQNLGVIYQPMIAGLFPFLQIRLPVSTVTMPAESMGAA